MMLRSSGFSLSALIKEKKAGFALNTMKPATILGERKTIMNHFGKEELRQCYARNELFRNLTKSTE